MANEPTEYNRMINSIGQEIVKIERSAAQKNAPTKTDLTYKIKDEVYPVYQTSQGGYFIIRTSKKSGKEYRMYLPTKE